jgi:hypothetical protein
MVVPNTLKKVWCTLIFYPRISLLFVYMILKINTFFICAGSYEPHFCIIIIKLILLGFEHGSVAGDQCTVDVSMVT